MSSKYGVFIKKTDGDNNWSNANDNLDIRTIGQGYNSIDGSPTIDTVPQILVMNENGNWEQIYPPTEKKSGVVSYSSNKFAHFKKCRTTNKTYGWDIEAGTAGQGFFGQDWINSGNQDTSLVNKEYIGWIDMGANARNKLPNASKVKKITSLTITVNRRNLTGLTNEECVLSVVLNNCAGPGNIEGANSPDPFTAIVGNKVDLFSMRKGNGEFTKQINLDSAQGKAIEQLFIKWMKGEAESIMIYNNERLSDCKVWEDYGRWSRNYTKITKFDVKMEYITEA